MQVSSCAEAIQVGNTIYLHELELSKAVLYLTKKAAGTTGHTHILLASIIN